MPEVCEVALLCEYLITKLKNRKIVNAKILSGKYANDGLNLELLINATIDNIESKGKFLWFTLKTDNKYVYFMNWFGLSGYWSFKKSSVDRIAIAILTDYNKKYTLYFSDQRNFALMQITHDANLLNKKIQSLAPDLLKSNITTNDFVDLFNIYLHKFPRRKHIAIVDLLLRQDIDDGVVSGIGNYLSAEILYRASISPFREINSLTHNEIVKLARASRTTVKLCYFYNKTPYITKINIKPDKFINYHEDINISGQDFNFLVYRKKTDLLGNIVVNNIVAKNRTTYWVPNVQK